MRGRVIEDTFDGVNSTAPQILAIISTALKTSSGQLRSTFSSVLRGWTDR